MFTAMSDAVAAIHSTDTLAVPLGPGVPGAFLHALGERDLPEGLVVFDVVRGESGGEALAIGRIPPEQASPAWGGQEG